MLASNLVSEPKLTWQVAKSSNIGKLFLVAASGLAAGFAVKKMILDSNPRQKIIDAARSQLGPQNPDKYWQDTQPALVGYPDKIAWCGGFALWALHQAGIAKDIGWKIGKGFTEINHLPRTSNPKPGDIAYFDQPYQHHAIVVSNIDGVLKTIDGNQPGNTVAERTRPTSSATAFYSIEPFLNA